jgi:hypothetical protein
VNITTHTLTVRDRRKNVSRPVAAHTGLSEDEARDIARMYLAMGHPPGCIVIAAEPDSNAGPKPSPPGRVFADVSEAGRG